MIYKVKELYYLCSENKDADQLHDYRADDLRLCFPYVKSRFSHNAAQTSFVAWKIVFKVSHHENKSV